MTEGPISLKKVLWRHMKGLEQEQPKSDLGRFGIELLLESIFQYLWLLQIWCAGAPPTGHNSQSKFDF